MRRTIGFVLIAIGAFALVLAMLLPLYVYPNVARLERGGQTTSHAVGSNMTVFNREAVNDPDAEVERTGVNVIANHRVKGIVEGADAKAYGDVAVWQVGLVVLDRDNPDAAEEPISVQEQKFCVDRRTSEAVHPCSSEYLKDPGRAEPNRTFTGPYKGQMYKFPFDTEARDYRFFDSTLRKAPTARFVKETTFDGLPVYKFEQVISRTKIEERELPGRLLGLPDQDNVVTERYYENRRVMWVEPETGVIVKSAEDVRHTLEEPDTGNTLTLLAGHLELSKQTVAANLERAENGASTLRMLHTTAPWTLGVTGAIVTLLGAWLALTTRRRTDNLFVDP